MAPAADPRAEYDRRAADRRVLSDRLGVRYHAFFRARTTAFVVIVGVAWICEKERLLPLLLLLPIVSFVSFVLEKNRSCRAWQRALRALRFYERRLANLNGRWAGTGDAGSRYLDDAHPCARDLDLFGPGSLFEHLHLTGSPLGEDTLAEWLRTPAPIEEIRERQAAVAELRDRLDLREQLALLGQQASRSDADRLPLSAIRVRVAAESFAAPLLRRIQTALAAGRVALGELEALNALAAYAYENPTDPFPDFSDGACFVAEGLAHPLLPAGRCVRNDVRLDADRRLLIVSGSNMSGKSTLLRAVGANAVLALAGAPVRAARLRLSHLTVGATLRLQDSLLEGRSRFFAEVTRVRQLLDLSQARPPLLFLLDELFSGTNSDDRQRGAEAVTRRLLDAGAIGLLTTHDLALTHLADVLAPRAVNVHFADQFTNGTMTFDYRMRDGVLRNGNGVALMRALGIDV